jgi:hypothetical protein
MNIGMEYIIAVCWRTAEDNVSLYCYKGVNFLNQLMS